MIPLIESNRWRHPKRPEDLDKTGKDEKKDEKSETNEEQDDKNDVDSLAVKELLRGMLKLMS